MINIAGVVSIVIFYVLNLAVGIWAGRKKKEGNDSEEEVMLAGRNIGLFVGIFTMTATWVGGGYINGTAEAIYTNGLIWCQAPFGYALSLVFGGIFFANKMRKHGYVTMLDPLQDCFGERMGGMLFIPALCGEVFWAAGILAALGATLSVIIDMDHRTSVIFSACIAVFYTLFGGLYSVAYTDVIQLLCIFISLWMCIPFAWMNEHVVPLSTIEADWMGEVKPEEYFYYIDYGLLLVFGGIPWQVYFQRVLSSKSAGRAQVLSYVAAVGCVLMAIPPVLIGAIAKGTAWNETEYRGPYPLSQQETPMVLPMVLQYLTPDFVSFFGLGAMSAAVMSSTDSSVLSASSMFARNVYKLMFRQKASEMEIIWVMRVAILAVGVLSTIMALTIPSIYGLWSMCSDLVYVILFPQLLMVVHFKHYCNTYGSLAAYIVAFFVRLSGGEPVMHLEPFIHYPGWDEENKIQLFPFRTMAMLLSLVTLVGVSWWTKWVFETGRLAPGYDIFRCVVNIPEDVEIVGERCKDGEQLSVMSSGAMGKMYGAATMDTDCLTLEANMRWAEAFILVYSIKDKCSFDECNRLKFLINYNKRRRRLGGGSRDALCDIPVVLVGNKNDQFEDRMVSLEEGQRRSKEIGCVCFHEISVRESIDQVFGVFHDVCRFWRLQSKCPSKLRRSGSEKEPISPDIIRYFCSSTVSPGTLIPSCSTTSNIIGRRWTEISVEEVVETGSQASSSSSSSENAVVPFRERASTDGNLLQKSWKWRYPPPAAESNPEMFYARANRRMSISMKGSNASC